MTTEKQIGTVSNYFDHVKVAAIKLTGPLKVGDVIKFVGGEVDYDMPIESIQIDNENVDAAKKGNEIGIKVKEKVRKEYKVYKVTSSE
jgi:translation elongation factor EF-1alpha